MARSSEGGKGAPKDPPVSTGFTGGGAAEFVTYTQLRDAMKDVMAHSHTKLSSVEARIERTLGELPNTTKMIFIVGGAAFTVIAFLVGTLLAILAFGGDRFDAGMSLTGATISYSVEAKRALEASKEQNEALAKQMQALAKAVERLQESQQPSKQK